MPRLAIIGSGIAGLGCTHFLHREHEVTLLEQDDHLGGHAHTVTVTEPATRAALPVDTGFMVFNRVTYPLLTRLLAELGVGIRPTSMSFSVRHTPSGLEYCGSSLNQLFAQRRNLLRPRFYRMLASIDRFNQDAAAALQEAAVGEMTLGEYVRRRAYGDDFLNLYLVPMAAAVWSTPPQLMYDFPAITLLRFFHNHGFLGLHTQHPWFTVEGGARAYVSRLVALWGDRVRRGGGAAQVRRTARGVTVRLRTGESQEFDEAILACHADQALALLADPHPAETAALQAFKYQPNLATLHTDAGVMPRSRRAWASWNYEISPDRGAATHYWMNSLQGVSNRENYFVSINRPEAIDPAKVIRRIAYEHPLFNLPALRAQPELARLNGEWGPRTRTYFAGSYFRYGFHEDALQSAAQLAEQLLARDPWAAAA